LNYEINNKRGNLMKKGILLLLTISLTVFVLSAIVLTISTVSGLNLLQSTQTENTPTVQNNPAPASVKPADSSRGNLNMAAPVLPQTSIDEKTAIGIAQSNSGVAVLSSNTADLVDLNGQVAYEVIFDLGKVYVDANSGIVLGNTIQITPEIAIQEASKALQLYQVIRVDLGAYQGQNYYIVQFRGRVNAYVSMKGVVTFISSSQPYNSNSQPNNQPKENDD
jgi:uncharacterized membrane protein YkoI